MLRPRAIAHLIPSSHYVLLALLFWAGLEIIFAWPRLIIPFTGLLLAVLAAGIVLLRIEEGGRWRLTQAVLPALAVVGVGGLSVLLPHGPLLHLYFAAGSFLFLWLLQHGAKLAYPLWNWALSMVVLFLNIAGILGFRFLLYLPVIFTLAAIFGVVFLVSFQALQRLTDSLSHALLLAIALAAALAELAWVLQFLPIHYIVQAAVLMVHYYVIFYILSVSFQRPVERRDVVEYAAVGAVALLLILISARWI